jgi:large subunit ribosomal protein L25
MKTVSLSGSPRENVGNKGTKALRTEGRVPGVIYGKGENIHFHVKETELDKHVFTPEVNFINIEVNGKEYKTVIKELQFHPVTDRVLHFDLFAISDEKELIIELPLTVVGKSPGVEAGGKLRQNYRKIKVKGLPGALPEIVTLSIDGLKIGQSIRLGEVNIPGVTCLGDMRDVVISVKTARNVVLEEDEGAEAEGEGTEGAEA